MNKIRISTKEFCILFLMTIISEDKISGIFGHELKQNKLIAYLISIVLSMLIFSMYYLIFKNTGFKDLFKTFDLLIGKVLTKGLVILYALYFLFYASLDTRDVIQYVHQYLLATTPAYLLRAAFLLTVYFTLLNGLEVLARVATILLNFVVIIFITFSILTVILNEPDLTHFLPLLEDGIKPLIVPSLIMAVSIPFGEFLVIMFAFQHLKEPKKSFKYGILTQGIAGFMIFVAFALNILILSVETLDYMLSPALRVTRRIDIEVFFQRFDLITLLTHVSLSYLKVTLLIYGAKHSLFHVIKFQKEKIFYIILCLIVLLVTIYYIPNYILNLKVGREIIMPYITPVFEFAIPFILFIISFIKKKKIKETDEKEEKKQNKEMKKEKIKENIKNFFNSLVKR